jgi:hypothetical protein
VFARKTVFFSNRGCAVALCRENNSANEGKIITLKKFL